MSKKPWSGRFLQDTDTMAEEFTASIDYDKRLYRYDIEGSIAHCTMLAQCEIITQSEADEIVVGLQTIRKEIEEGRFSFERRYEDIHMNIEKRLIDLIGEVGGKLHTARSRNDQVSLDTRLYLRDEIYLFTEIIESFQEVFLDLAEDNIDVIMPGYTHMQRAQPVLFSHHMLAYYNMLMRDRERYEDCLKRVSCMPLGCAAIAGTTFPINRDAVAKALSFSTITTNSIDTVSDRDFLIEFCSTSSLIMMHLSRLCEELILWSSAEFNFVELDDAFCTGSSIMPQKKNPDICELVRGKTGRVYGNLISLLTLMKGLPLAYNRDMQEDKEALFDTVDTVKASLLIMSKVLKTMKIKKETLQRVVEEDFMAATDIADYLVRKGMPFRNAHEVVGKAVAYCIKEGKGLDTVTIEEYKQFSPLIEEDIFNCVSIERSVNAKISYGGTAKQLVQKRIEELRKGNCE